MVSWIVSICQRYRQEQSWPCSCKGLTGLEIEKIKEEYAEILEEIEHYKKYWKLELRMQIIKDELPR
jgi:DNA gyrase/topoisomerase IV subunit A